MTETMPERDREAVKSRTADAPIPEAEQLPDARTSMCCHCGNVRTVKATHPPRGSQSGEGEPPSRIRDMRQTSSTERARAYWQAQEPWERCLELLKCKVCGVETKHAFLREGPYRDFAEEQNQSQEDVVRAWIRQFRDRGFRVKMRRAPTKLTSGKTLVCEIYQYLDDGQWFLDVDATTPVHERAQCLRWAWEKYTADTADGWWVYPARKEGDVAYRIVAWGCHTL